MNLLIASCNVPFIRGFREPNERYAEQCVDDASRCIGVEAVRIYSDVYDGTPEGCAKALDWVGWADIVRVYTGLGTDPATINLERMAERMGKPIERVCLPPREGTHKK